MSVDPIQALRAANRPPVPSPAPQALLIAGATGVLGNEVMRRLVGTQRFATTRVLAREAITPALRTVSTLLVADEAIDCWPAALADTGVILFDPPRLYYDRERALWTPQPGQLVDLARWMHRSGVRTLVIVLPHEQGRLPEALKRGLANLDEHAVVALGFERVLIVRSARRAEPGSTHAGFLEKTAAWMLSIAKLMVPASEQPVRASKVAELVDEALQVLPPGIHVAAPELVSRAAQGSAREVVRAWLYPRQGESTAKSGA